MCTESPPTKIYTLSLHDALPICVDAAWVNSLSAGPGACWDTGADVTVANATSRGSRPATVARASVSATAAAVTDRKSTRLNSSHGYISYAVFCLKKKKIN